MSMAFFGGGVSKRKSQVPQEPVVVAEDPKPAAQPLAPPSVVTTNPFAKSPPSGNPFAKPQSTNPFASGPISRGSTAATVRSAEVADQFKRPLVPRGPEIDLSNSTVNDELFTELRRMLFAGGLPLAMAEPRASGPHAVTATVPPLIRLQLREANIKVEQVGERVCLQRQTR